MSIATFASKTLLLLMLPLFLSGCFESSEERAAEHLENGLKLVEEGDLPRALVEFRNTLELDDGNLDALRQMGRANLELDRFQEAYGSFLRLVERAPGDVEGRVTLSELAFLGRDWEEFERHGEKVVEIAATEPAAKAVKLGLEYRAALLSKNTEQGRVVLAQAETLAAELPENAIVRRLRIDGYMSEGKYTEALDLIDESIADTPQDYALYAPKLQLLARLGDEAGLEAELRNMLEVFPGERSTQETFLRFLISRKRLDDAEAFLQELFASAGPEDRNEALLNLVTFIRQSKGPEAALAQIDAAQAQGDGTLNGMEEVLRASITFDLGRHEEGIATLERVLADDAVAINPQEVQRAKTVLAQMLLTSGNEVGARKHIEEILAADGNAAGALKMRAAWLIADDDTNGAINDLRLALDNQPDDADAMVLMSQAYERAGQKDLMQNFLARAVESSNNAPRYALRYARALAGEEKFLDAESTLIASLRIAPGNVEVLSALGNIYLQLKDVPRAEQVAKTLGNIETDPAQKSANRLQVEVMARKLGVDQALQFLETQAAEAGSDDTALKLTLIQARLRAGKVGEALNYAKDAAAAEPENLQLRNALALSYAASRQFDAAEAEYEKMLAGGTDAAGIYIQLARIKSAKGDPEAAHATVDRGLTAFPDAPDLLWGKASYLQRLGDIDGAIEIYEGLYARNSGNMIVANNLSSLLATYREDEDSLARAETIARRLQGTEVPAFQDTYGWVLFRQGKAEEALGYLEPAAAGLPKDPTVLFHLGEAYAALDRAPDGLAQMRKALDVSGPLGDENFRQKIQSRITELEAITDN